MPVGVIALVTFAALAVGAAGWFGLLWRHRRQPLSVRHLFLIVLLLGTVCRLVYALATPVFYAPDEQSHFNYVKQLAEKHSLPVLTKGLGDPANEWEFHQPPLYYLLLVPVYWAAQILFPQPDGAVFALRLCSVFLWMLNVWFGVAFLKRLQTKDEFQWLCVLTLGCLLPTHVFVSSAINNDNLLILLGTAALWLLMDQERTLRKSAALGVLLGLGLLAKPSGVVLFPAVGLLVVLEAVQRRITPRAAIVHLVTVFGLATLLYAPWAARNWRLYATFTPESLTVIPRQWPSMVDGLLSAAHNLTKTFWSVSGISNDIGYPFPLLGMGFGLLCIAGLVLGRKQHPQPLKNLLTAANAPVVVALSFAVLLNVILVLRLGYLYGMGQGRHLFPLLYPIALGLAWGLRSIPGNHPSVQVVGFWVTYALAFEAFSLCRFPS